MDDQVRAIQARLRATLAQPMRLGEEAKGLPLISFEDVAGVPTGAETLVHRVVTVLKNRGYRVACLRRFSSVGMPGAAAQVGAAYTDAGADAVVFSMPGRLVKVETIEEEPTFEQMLGALGDAASYDVIVGESFSWLPIPKVLVTRKVQEGFNLGLSNVVAYVSGGPNPAMVIPYFAPDDEEGIADFIERRIVGAEGPARSKQLQQPEEGGECEGGEP